MSAAATVNPGAPVYGAIAEWLLYPEDVADVFADEDAATGVFAAARALDPQVAEHLEAFWRERYSVGPEAYLALLELDPRCPLYLGSYQFPEPTTCSAAGVSDRNQYMLEIGNVFRHFGFEITGELPDYLPALVEFLALAGARDEADAALRERFIRRLMLPGVRIFAERLEEAESIYARLAQALLLCLESEAGEEPEDEPAPAAEPDGLHGKVVPIQ